MLNSRTIYYMLVKLTTYIYYTVSFTCKIPFFNQFKSNSFSRFFCCLVYNRMRLSALNLNNLTANFLAYSNSVQTVVVESKFLNQPLAIHLLIISVFVLNIAQT